MLLLIIPSVENANLIWNLVYLLTAMIVCSIGLNFVVYCNYPLPALDELCYGIGVALKSTYGKGKLIGELLALFLAVIAGLIFSHYEQHFFIGVTTIIFALGIGKMIDLFKKPIFRILEAIDAN
jgi:uncharacterized membrane protein YczE